MNTKINKWNVERYKKRNFHSFVRDWDIFLVYYLEGVRVSYWMKHKENVPEEVNPESDVMVEMAKYFWRTLDVLADYKEHCLNIDKPIPYYKKDPSIEAYNKYLFLHRKIVGNNDVILNSKKIDELHKNKKLTKSLVGGKILNLLDRFNLVNKITDLDGQLRKMNMKDMEKYELLSFILGCNKDNARALMNGNYDAKPNDLSDLFKKIDLSK